MTDEEIPAEQGEAPAPWKAVLAPAAIRDLDQLSARVVPAIVEFLFGPLTENPERVGEPLRGELAGTYSARRGSYRVLYELDEESRTVRVYRIAARATGYRPR